MTKKRTKVNSKAKTDSTTDSLSDVKSLNKKGFNFRDNIIQYASIFIALLSLGFTIWQASKIREFNKLSVLPKLQITYNNYLNGDFQIKVKNAGIGPAVIDDMNFISKSGRTYSVRALSGDFWYSVFKDENISDSIVYKNLTHYYLDPGGIIPAKEELDLFGVVANGLSIEDRIKALTIMLNSTIRINYHSVYNTNFKDSLKITELKVISFSK